MRITKVTTKGGDEGQTSLGDGQRISKNHLRVHAIGVVDKLNSVIGWTRSVAKNGIKDDLEKIQQDLFNLGGELAVPGGDRSGATHVLLDRRSGVLGPPCGCSRCQRVSPIDALWPRPGRGSTAASRVRIPVAQRCRGPCRLPARVRSRGRSRRPPHR